MRFLADRDVPTVPTTRAVAVVYSWRFSRNQRAFSSAGNASDARIGSIRNALLATKRNR